ncbi:GGDEF domain-containing protein [Curvibacter sp. PAE-UM]|uniref:GGDEF domain-containing protein n=1 Tax=Curvibacter sp. PAE-UM TaxID=1714344 RepID=UPI00071049A7|nr:GGDEF domain-containing protein [Curvibacter sp. PAE-UM]KRI01444.1 hypothetical protein AO057_08380 [Curvibacter sp. PAE-UM]
MPVSEVAVWSSMLGGLLTLTALAMADALFNRKRGSLRNLVFVLIAGASCVVMTGLPEVLWPGLPQWLLQLLKGSLGPLAGAMALNYLGIWLGGSREDRTVYRITTWGAGVLFLASLALAAMVARASPEEFQQLLLVTAVVNMAAAVLGLVATLRAATLGDPLARWMVLACVLLAALVGGLYLRGLNVPGFGLGTWIFTATITVVYFLACSVLVFVRNRQQRQLTRLSRLQVGADPATGLPTGSLLLSEVEHAFWRTARLHGSCTVVCLHLRNLYELGQAAGHGVEHQILAAMAARIRRAAGFRCVVGLYHPRCFVVVISTDSRHEFVNETIARLRATVGRPLMVVGRDQSRHDYTPQLGMGIVTLEQPGDAVPLDMLNEAERLSLGSDGGNVTSPPSVRPSQDAIDTAW